jgi:hypothetical protein
MTMALDVNCEDYPHLNHDDPNVVQHYFQIALNINLRDHKLSHFRFMRGGVEIGTIDIVDEAETLH